MVVHKVRTLELGERGRGGSAKSIMAHVGGGGGSAVRVRFFRKFVTNFEKKNKESELFRKPKLFIPIFPVQLKAQLSSQGSSWCFDLLFFYSFVQWFIL